MHNHKHDHCKHLNLAYCSVCDVVYCKDCEREWGVNTWYYQPWTFTYPFSTIGIPYCGTTTCGTTTCGTNATSDVVMIGKHNH